MNKKMTEARAEYKRLPDAIDAAQTFLDQIVYDQLSENRLNPNLDKRAYYEDRLVAEYEIKTMFYASECKIRYRVTFKIYG